MYFTYNNIKMYYKKYGNKKKTILILPGWGNTSPTFNNIINYFKEEYTIYIVDYPGLGESPIPIKELTLLDYADIIRNFIKKEKMTNITIIAHSFGGRVTALLLSYYKVETDKLILIDVAGIKKRKTLKQIIKQTIYKALIKLTKLLPILKRKKYEEILIKLFGSTDFKNLNPIMRNTFKNIVNQDLKKYYKGINNETIIIWGKKDIDTPLSDGLIINKLIKNAEIIIYPYSSHFSYLEEPYLTNKIINEFLKEKET